VRVGRVDHLDTGRARGGEQLREPRDDALRPLLVPGPAGVGNRAAGIHEIVRHVDDE